MKRALILRRVAALAALLCAPAAAAAAERSVPPGLTPAQPVLCSGNQDVELVRRYIATEGDAVTARGNCTVTLRQCVIEAGGVAVRASDNAEVRIVGSEISGARGSVWANDMAAIHFEDSTLRGRRRAADMSELIDHGGNTIEGGGPAGSPAGPSGDVDGGTVRVGDTEVSGTGVRIGGVDVVEIDEEGVTVGPGGVEVSEEGVTVGRGGVVVTDKGVRTGGETVVIGEDGSVSVVSGSEVVVVDADGNVRVDSPDGTVVVSGDWRQGGVVYTDTEGILIELGARSEGESLQMDLASDVLFDFDSAVVRGDAAATLSKVAHVIRRRATGRVEVIGHTDAIGSAEYNQRLSEERALAVMRWLNETEGIPLRLMVGRGRGASRPIAHNTMPDGSDNPAGRARNRRVELRIVTGS